MIHVLIAIALKSLLIAGATLGLLEHRFRKSHLRIGLTFKQSFGGGVAK